MKQNTYDNHQNYFEKVETAVLGVGGEQKNKKRKWSETNYKREYWT